jgi:hypothetical protein
VTDGSGHDAPFIGACALDTAAGQVLLGSWRDDEVRHASMAAEPATHHAVTGLQQIRILIRLHWEVVLDVSSFLAGSPFEQTTLP